MIHDLSVQLVGAWHDTSWVELLAAALALIYVPLAIGQRLSCWFAAFVSSVLYVWVFFSARLYMESALNAFFAAMAVYGFWQWRQGREGSALAVSRWPPVRHVLALMGIAAVAAINAFLLARFTPAANPFIDSMLTWSSVFTTFLVARKVYENWYWWLLIDSISMCLYLTRHLYLTMLLYGVYVVLCVIGMREWRRSLPSAAYAAA
ncbi:MAG TPA: nicotinamide riboside transporter PnuC [Steroidobacteraceae bacterium]|nr:nicotinamide riboside transporter PnuC [Steroidobacteraceae bacterium]